MMKISVVDEKRAGKNEFKNFDMAAYSKATFGMYHGTKTKVKIEFANHMCGVFIDRFGKDISFVPVDDECSTVTVDVNVSPQFFGWIFGLGSDVRIVGPEEVVEELRAAAEEMIKNLK